MVDTNAAFGFAPSGGLYGAVADAGADIMRYRGIGPIAKWVDDHVFLRIRREHLADYNLQRGVWRDLVAGSGEHHSGGRTWFGGDLLPDGRTNEFVEDMAFPIADLSSLSSRSGPDCSFTYAFCDIDRVSAELGIPWQLGKDIPFSSTFPFTGFVWDLAERTVGVPRRKADKYLVAIQVWRSSRIHTLADVQRLYGKLLHTTLVVPAGRAYLVHLEHMLGIFGNNPFMPRTPPRGLPADLDWWCETLQRPSLTRPIPGPVVLTDLAAFSDASSGTGVAVVIGERWRAWSLRPHWNRDGRDIAWAEALGFELLARYVLRTAPPGQHLKVYGDNVGVVEGWWNGRSRNPHVNGIFKHIHALCESTQCALHPRYVRSASNPADGPSRGIYPPPHLLLPAIPISTDLAPFLVDFDSPLAAPLPLAVRRSRPPASLAGRSRAASEFEASRRQEELAWGAAHWRDAPPL